MREPEYSPTAIEGQYLPSRTAKRTPYVRNVFEPSLQYQFEKEDSLAINYRNNIYNIKSQVGENSVENTINSTLTYWFDIKNGVSFQYGVTDGKFQRSPDLLGHMAMGRYTYRFNPNTSVFGEYSQVWRDFKPPSIDFRVYRPSFGIQHAFSSTLSGTAQLGYFWQDPEKGSTKSGFSYDANLSQRADKTTYTISIQGGYTEDLFSAQNLGFAKNHRAIGTITHQLLQKMNVGLLSSYEWTEYPGAAIGGGKATDRIWTVGGNASYQILRWLMASLNVSRRENDSNISNRNYSEYVGMLKITATY